VQIDINEKKESSTALNIFTLIAVTLIVALPIYVYFRLKPETIFNDQEKEVIENEKEEQNDIPESIKEEETPILGEGYVEELVEIEGEWAYIVSPAYIDIENLPTLIIYNHGSVTFVEENMDQEFKELLLEYGKAFTPHNYIFAASNAHGVNWGSTNSVIDNYNMYQYIKDRYGIQERINLIGFSMGGLPTINFTTTYPDLVTKIAMLAPTTKISQWDQERVEKIMNIDIKIWHGSADVNVPLIYTQNWVSKVEALGKDIDFNILDGKTHWDLDGKYTDEILEFFNN
jgi:hypothetical protein